MDGRTDGKQSIGPLAMAGFASIVALTMAITPSAVRAGESVNTGYFGDVAIKGYDPVAYFTEGQAVKGSKEHVHRWLGATWHFASAEHKEMFSSEPVKFAPQYGGYCADGVSFGTITTNIDPTAFRIIDGKLFLNYDPGAASGLEANLAKVTDGQKYWPDVRASLVSGK